MDIRVSTGVRDGCECVQVSACVYNAHLYKIYPRKYTVKNLLYRYTEVLANVEHNISYGDEVVGVVFDDSNIYFSMREGDADDDLELRCYSKKSILACLRELIDGLEKCLNITGTLTSSSTC